MVSEPRRSGSHLAKAACSSSSFLASCILSSAIWACSSAIWSCRSLESPSSFRRVFSNSCLCFSSRRRRSNGDGDTFSYTDDTLKEQCMSTEKYIYLSSTFFPDNKTVQTVAGLHYFVRTYIGNYPHILPSKYVWAISLPVTLQPNLLPHFCCNDANTVPVSHHAGISTHLMMLNASSALPLLKLNRQSPEEEHPSRTLKNLCKQAIRNCTNPERLMLLEVEK